MKEKLSKLNIPNIYTELKMIRTEDGNNRYCLKIYTTKKQSEKEWFSIMEYIQKLSINLQTLEIISNEEQLIKDEVTMMKIQKTISECKNLTSFIMRGVQLGEKPSLIYLEDLIYLEHLEIISCGIRDIVALRNLVNLNYLDLSDNLIRDIDALKNLIDLEYLDLTNKIFKIEEEYGITDLSPISGLIKLTYFNAMGHFKLKDIRALKDMSDLEEICLAWCGIESIDVLKDKQKIRRLHLEDNEIADISALENHHSLEYLRLDMNSIKDITPLANNRNLKVLDLSYNLIQDASVVANLEKLVELSLDHCFLSTIDFIENLQSLTSVTISQNQIDNISIDKLRRLKNIEVFEIEENCLSEENARELEEFISENFDIAFFNVGIQTPKEQAKQKKKI